MTVYKTSFYIFYYSIYYQNDDCSVFQAEIFAILKAIDALAQAQLRIRNLT